MVAEKRKVNTQWVPGNRLIPTGVAVNGTVNRKRWGGGGGERQDKIILLSGLWSITTRVNIQAIRILEYYKMENLEIQTQTDTDRNRQKQRQTETETDRQKGKF